MESHTNAAKIMNLNGHGQHLIVISGIANLNVHLLVIPGELRSANSKAFFSSSTTSLFLESLPPAPCFLAN